MGTITMRVAGTLFRHPAPSQPSTILKAYSNRAEDYVPRDIRIAISPLSTESASTVITVYDCRTGNHVRLHTNVLSQPPAVIEACDYRDKDHLRSLDPDNFFLQATCPPFALRAKPLPWRLLPQGSLLRYAFLLFN